MESQWIIYKVKVRKAKQKKTKFERGPVIEGKCMHAHDMSGTFHAALRKCEWYGTRKTIIIGPLLNLLELTFLTYVVSLLLAAL